MRKQGLAPVATQSKSAKIKTSMNVAFNPLLILGLDALPWRVLTPMMRAGHTPRLAALAARGCSGNLRSTIPHQTPSAWTTFMTGVHPSTHGIVNWQHYDARENAMTMNNVERFAGKTIYERLSAAGLKIGVVLQPGCYPPFEVNGYLLSGMDAPGVKSRFASPREIEREILEICPEHECNIDIDKKWDLEGHDADDGVFCRNIAVLNEHVQRVTRLALELNRRHPSDALMVYFQDPDLLLHRAWRWCDPETWSANEIRRDAVAGFFKTLDAACGALIDGTKIDGAERLTLVLSDHGQRPDEKRVRLNSILIELGFLTPEPGVNPVTKIFRRFASKLEERGQQGLGLAVDWKRTRAFMPFQSCTGFIYVNLEGRQPHGSVKVEHFEKVRDELIAALRAYRDPSSGENYFEEVAAMDAAHGWKKELLLPDIYVQPKAGIEFVRRAKVGEISFPTKRAYAGLHDPDGLYILDGAGVARSDSTHAHIVDLAPTLLAALNQPVPSYMEGRVLNECFTQPLQVRTLPFEWDAKTAGEAYTEEGAAAVEKRLADLGYLD